LMLLEYFRVEAFRRLAEIQFAQDGIPKELGEMEKAVRPQTEPTEIRCSGEGAPLVRRVRPRLPWAAAVGSF